MVSDTSVWGKGRFSLIVYCAPTLVAKYVHKMEKRARSIGAKFETREGFPTDDEFNQYAKLPKYVLFVMDDTGMHAQKTSQQITDLVSQKINNLGLSCICVFQVSYGKSSSRVDLTSVSRNSQYKVLFAQFQDRKQYRAMSLTHFPDYPSDAYNIMLEWIRKHLFKKWGYLVINQNANADIDTEYRVI